MRTIVIVDDDPLWPHAFGLVRRPSALTAVERVNQAQASG